MCKHRYLGRSRQNDVALLCGPLEEDLARSDTELGSDLLHDLGNGSLGERSKRCSWRVGLNCDPLGVAEIDDGFGLLVDVRVELDLCPSNMQQG